MNQSVAERILSNFQLVDCPHHSALKIGVIDDGEILVHCPALDLLNDQDDRRGCPKLYLVARGCPFVNAGHLICV